MPQLEQIIRRGDVGFSTHHEKLLSKLVRWFTRYEFSHSFIVTDTIQDRVYLLEAEHPRVTVNQLGNYDLPNITYEIWRPNGVTSDQIDRAVHRTVRMFLKKRYSLASLAGIGIKILMERHCAILIRNPLRMGAWCAEMDWYYLTALMPELFSGLDHTTVSPKDLHEIVKNSGRFELITVRASEFVIRD